MARVVGYALQIVGVVMNAYTPGSGNYFIYAGTALVVGDSIEQQRRAKRRALAQYNSSLEDRLEMVERDPNQARTLVYGRVRAVEGVRRSFVSGPNSERLTMIVSVAGHEIDGFETVYFNDIELTLDTFGQVTTTPYAKSVAETYFLNFTLNGSGAAVVTLPPGVNPAIYTATTRPYGGIDAAPLVVSIDPEPGSPAIVSGGPPGAPAQLQYQAGRTDSKARVRFYTGTDTQNVGADLASEYPGHLTATDRFAGIALMVIDLDYDPDVFPQGRPNVTARFRGKRCYDPRRDSTVDGGSGAQRLGNPATWTWTDNPALHAYDYARHPNGWAVPAAEIRQADVVLAADVCDQVVPLNLVTS